MQLIIASVDLCDSKLNAGKGFAGLLVDLQQAQAGFGAVYEVHRHVLVRFSVDPDGLRLLVSRIKELGTLVSSIS